MEFLTLCRVWSYPPRVETVDCFGGMEAVIRYIIEHPSYECFYCITDIGDNIRACGMIAGDKLIIMNSQGEVTSENRGGGTAT